MKRHAKSHARKHESGLSINPEDEDEKITGEEGGTNPFNLRVRSGGNNPNEGAENGESLVAPLKIKNLNELMAAKDQSVEVSIDAERNKS